MVLCSGDGENAGELGESKSLRGCSNDDKDLAPDERSRTTVEECRAHVHDNDFPTGHEGEGKGEELGEAEEFLRQSVY